MGRTQDLQTDSPASCGPQSPSSRGARSPPQVGYAPHLRSEARPLSSVLWSCPHRWDREARTLLRGDAEIEVVHGHLVAEGPCESTDRYRCGVGIETHALAPSWTVVSMVRGGAAASILEEDGDYAMISCTIGVTVLCGRLICARGHFRITSR